MFATRHWFILPRWTQVRLCNTLSMGKKYRGFTTGTLRRDGRGNSYHRYSCSKAGRVRFQQEGAHERTKSSFNKAAAAASTATVAASTAAARVSTTALTTASTTTASTAASTATASTAASAASTADTVTAKEQHHQHHHQQERFHPRYHSSAMTINDKIKTDR